MLVGSSRERRGFDTSVDPAVSEAMVARAARLFPRVRGAAGRRRRGRGCGRGCPTTCRRSARRARVPGLWLATGHEGAGVALGPVTGRLVAQLLCGEAPVVDPAPFDPDRFGAATAALKGSPRCRGRADAPLASHIDVKGALIRALPRCCR